MPVGKEDLLDISGIMAGLPDTLDHQITGLRIKPRIDENQSLSCVKQEHSHIILASYIPYMGSVLVSRYRVLPVGGHAIVTKASCCRRVKEFLFHIRFFLSII